MHSLARLHFLHTTRRLLLTELIRGLCKCHPKQWIIAALLISIANTAWAEHRLGQGLPFEWYEDSSAALNLDEVLALPESDWHHSDHPKSLGYTRSALWLKLFIPKGYFNDGIQLLQTEPNHLDQLSFFYRPANINAPWQEKQAGDRWPQQRGDIRYRYPVFILDPPPHNAEGYEVLFRAQSTGALLLNMSLWSRAEFVEQAMSSTIFWSFYLGLAGISTCLALLLAIFLRSRLLWSVFVFCSSYVIVAALQGYIDWLFGRSSIPWQHYLTGASTLLSYAGLLWMCAEVLNLRVYLPRIYTGLLIVSAIISLQLISIPLDFYGQATTAIGLVVMLSAPLFMGCTAWLLYKNGFSLMTLLFGVAPLLYVFSGIQALLALYGIISLGNETYGIWQYTVMLNIMTILGLIIYKVRGESRQRQAKILLAKELEVERAASFQQRQFIDMVSHEFRTPLAVISAAIENLKLGLTTEHPQFLRYERINRATYRLVQLTDNCLADSRLLADQLYLDMQPTCLLNLAQEVMTTIDISSKQHLLLTFNGHDVPPDFQHDTQVMVDSGLIRIALFNLLDNAVKYAANGIISLDIQVTESGFVISVQDQGPGITSSQADDIFQRYQRAEHPEGKKEGLGLGLYIVANIAKAHGGDARLAANTHTGCRFELYLPCNMDV